MARESATTLLSSLTASSTSSLLGFAFLFRIAVASSSLKTWNYCEAGVAEMRIKEIKLLWEGVWREAKALWVLFSKANSAEISS